MLGGEERRCEANERGGRAAHQIAAALVQDPFGNGKLLVLELFRQQREQVEHGACVWRRQRDASDRPHAAKDGRDERRRRPRLEPRDERARGDRQLRVNRLHMASIHRGAQQAEHRISPPSRWLPVAA